MDASTAGVVVLFKFSEQWPKELVAGQQNTKETTIIIFKWILDSTYTLTESDANDYLLGF